VRLDKSQFFAGILGLLIVVLLVVMVAAMRSGPTQTDTPGGMGANDLLAMGSNDLGATSENDLGASNTDSTDPIIGTWTDGYEMYTFDTTTCTITSTWNGRTSTSTSSYTYMGIVSCRPPGSFYYSVNVNLYRLNNPAGAIEYFGITNNRLYLVSSFRLSLGTELTRVS
jgi:hypothetical protein